MFDGSSISRFPKVGWGTTPNVKQELEAVQERLDEIRLVAKGSDLWWTMGNHDQRFEARLAQNVPEYAGVAGFTLKDHFPHWAPCWSVWINDDVVIKHRSKSGIHAPHNNTMWAGKTIITSTPRGKNWLWKNFVDGTDLDQWRAAVLPGTLRMYSTPSTQATCGARWD